MFSLSTQIKNPEHNPCNPKTALPRPYLAHMRPNTN